MENFLCQEDIEMFDSLMTTNPEISTNPSATQTTQSSSSKYSTTPRTFIKKSKTRSRNYTRFYNDTVVPTGNG